MPQDKNLSTSDDTRKRIIEAAMQLFSREGYTRSATRHIAEAAGVNEVTLFRHFGNKKNLLLAVMETFNQAGFAATFETALSGDYPADIARMARLQLKNTADNLDTLRLLLSDTRQVPELQEAMQAGSSSNMAILAGYFQRQIEAGVIRPGLPAAVLAAAFDSLFSTTVILANLFTAGQPPRLPGDDSLDPLVDLFVRGTQAAHFIQE